MSKLLRGLLINPNKLQVQIVYNLDVEENAHLDTTDGVVVESEPIFPEAKIGKGFFWFVNPKTSEQWFEEFDRPLTVEEQLVQQSDTQAQILMALVANDLI